jgi:capsular polysaccharide transport system ATP-binding protein
VIELDRVAKSYRGAVGRRVLLDNVSAEFRSGHNFGILGANGAGKSTLIRLLAGSEMPDCGTIHRRVRVSFPLGFGGTVHGALSGRENVAFIARVYGAGVRRMTRFVEEFAELGEYFRYYGANPYSTQRGQMRLISASFQSVRLARSSIAFLVASES